MLRSAKLLRSRRMFRAGSPGTLTRAHGAGAPCHAPPVPPTPRRRWAPVPEPRPPAPRPTTAAPSTPPGPARPGRQRRPTRRRAPPPPPAPGRSTPPRQGPSPSADGYPSVGITATRRVDCQHRDHPTRSPLSPGWGRIAGPGRGGRHEPQRRDQGRRIERQRLTAYRVAKRAGIKPDVVSRSLSGGRDVELLPAPPGSRPRTRARPGSVRQGAGDASTSTASRRSNLGRGPGAVIASGQSDGSATTETSPLDRRRDSPMSGVDRCVVSQRRSGRIVPDALACPGPRRDDGTRGDRTSGAVGRVPEGILAMLERVVSGGQTGADQAGWRTSPSGSSGTRSASPATVRRTRRVTGGRSDPDRPGRRGSTPERRRGNLERRTPLGTPAGHSPPELPDSR